MEYVKLRVLIGTCSSDPSRDHRELEINENIKFSDLIAIHKDLINRIPLPVNTLVFTSEKSFHITERAAGATASLSDVYKQHLVRKSAPRPPCTRALALRLSESYAKFMDIRRERIAAELSVLNKMKERTSVPHRVRTDLQTPPPGTPHVLRP